MPRNEIPDASDLVIAAQDDNSRGSSTAADMPPADVLDIMHQSDSTINSEQNEYDDFAGEDGRYQAPHRSAGFFDPSMAKIRGEVIYTWARTR